MAASTEKKGQDPDPARDVISVQVRTLSLVAQLRKALDDYETEIKKQSTDGEESG